MEFIIFNDFIILVNKFHYTLHISRIYTLKLRFKILRSVGSSYRYAMIRKFNTKNLKQ